MKLLAIGGPRHGEELPYTEGQQRLVVPVIPDLRAVAVWGRTQYCIHGATIASKSDGDQHFVSAARIADLYGLRRDEWHTAPISYANHATDKWCLFPDYWGMYDRSRLAPLVGVEPMTITAANYERRVVSDRVVWVFVGP